jgi:RNA polymerase sigma-70 factor (ECF subfamily)
MSNESLVAGWRSRWNRSLFRFLGQRVRAKVDIEDLAQETYLRLLRARDLGAIRNPHAYLLRAAGNVVIEWRQQQPSPGSVVDIDEDLVADDSTPDFELEASVSQERLENVLANASPTMRAVLLLRLRDDRSCAEIAKDLDLTARQVRRYVARGYEKLRQALEG